MLKPLRFLVMTISGILISLVFFSSAQATSQPKVNQSIPPMTRLASLLDHMQSFQSRFVQIAIQNGKSATHTGKLTLAKPRKFLWQLDKPDNQTIVADGKDLWIYDQDLAQVTVQPLSQQMGDVPLLLISGDSNALARYFSLESYQQVQSDVQIFQLQAKEESSLIRRVSLIFKNNLLSEMSVEDSSGLSSRLQFQAPSINQKVAVQIFHFIPPVGVDILGKPSP